MAAFILVSVDAFAPTQKRISSPTRISLLSSNNIISIRSPIHLQASEGEDEQVGLPPLPSQKNAEPKVEQPAVVEAAPTPSPVASSTDVASTEEEGTSYPINLPSPILLASSMVLAISSIGKEMV